MKGPEKAVKVSLVVTALLLPLAWPAPGSADGPRTRAADFIGLWAGIDLDGSFAQHAITCDDDRTCQVLGSDQFFLICEEHGGRGILAGAGTLEGGVITVPELTLTCADGTHFSALSTFSLDRRNGTLIDVTEQETRIFHRLSPRVDRRH